MPLERETDTIVFERCRVDANEGEVGSKVFLMACGAGAVRYRCVIPEPRLDPGAQQFVTREAQIVRDAAFAQSVTLRAGPDTFQPGVGGRELPRGNQLRGGRCSTRHQQHRDACDGERPTSPAHAYPKAIATATWRITIKSITMARGRCKTCQYLKRR